jgi:hypothetical protein
MSTQDFDLIVYVGNLYEMLIKRKVIVLYVSPISAQTRIEDNP